jgi:hypothetical protein
LGQALDPRFRGDDESHIDTSDVISGQPLSYG